MRPISHLTSNLPQKTGLMRTPFILQVFATHLNCIVGAEDVPSLEATGPGIRADSSVVMKYPPAGALALAAAAVSICDLYIKRCVLNILRLRELSNSGLMAR
jgi:hypothetical protein